MTHYSDDSRIHVLYGYLFSRKLQSYHDYISLNATLERAKSHCLRTKKIPHLIVFSVIHAEIAPDTLEIDSSPRKFLRENLPAAFGWYDRIVSATTTRAIVVPHGQELQLHLPERDHITSGLNRAVDDASGNLVEIVSEAVNHMHFYTLLKAAGLKPDG